MEAILDGSKCTDRKVLHEQLKLSLGLPEYYGNNLDALYDCASTMKDVHLHLVHWGVLVEQLGHYGELVIRTLMEAADENPGFELVLEDENEDDVEI